MTLGGRLLRNDIVAVLAGEGAHVRLDGCYLVDGERLVDNHTTIDHATPHCTSHELYKGILDGRARAVFNGRIIVREDAQKTDAKQTNRALLLSDEAQINSNPQLEIFADDVKCTHGAAIGQLDEEALFYLRARGLTLRDARDMLIHAYAGEVLERHRDRALRQQLERELFRSAGSGPGRARSARCSGESMRDSRPGVRRRGGPRRLSRFCASSVHGKPLVYLDSANTSQKPQVGARRDGRLLRARPTPTSIARRTC